MYPQHPGIKDVPILFILGQMCESIVIFFASLFDSLGNLVQSLAASHVVQDTIVVQT